MIRIGSAAASLAPNDGPTPGPAVSPSSGLSALISNLPAASLPAPPEQEAPSLDAAPSIGVPFAQHAAAEGPEVQQPETSDRQSVESDTETGKVGGLRQLFRRA